jgi:hypothetical protein
LEEPAVAAIGMAGISTWALPWNALIRRQSGRDVTDKAVNKYSLLPFNSPPAYSTVECAGGFFSLKAASG